MEGAGAPAELIGMKDDLRARASAGMQTGSWLTDAMKTSWESAAALLPGTQFADLLGQRHRIIANNMLAASVTKLSAMLVPRAVQIVDVGDFAPDSLPADLAGPRNSPHYLFSTAELLDRAADPTVMETTHTRDSEPAWRTWQAPYPRALPSGNTLRLHFPLLRHAAGRSQRVAAGQRRVRACLGGTKSPVTT